MGLLAPLDRFSEVPVIGFTKRMVFPGQDVVRSRYSGNVQVVGRGPGHWAGSITWLPTNNEHLRALDLFFSCLEGEANHYDLRLPTGRYGPRDAPPSGLRLVTADTGVPTTSQGATFLAVDVTRQAGGAGVIRAGQYINIGARLYQAIDSTTLLDSFPIHVLPVARVAVGASLTLAAPFVRARAAVSEQGLTGHTGHANDPVVWDWEEVV